MHQDRHSQAHRSSAAARSVRSGDTPDARSGRPRTKKPSSRKAKHTLTAEPFLASLDVSGGSSRKSADTRNLGYNRPLEPLGFTGIAGMVEIRLFLLVAPSTSVKAASLVGSTGLVASAGVVRKGVVDCRLECWFSIMQNGGGKPERPLSAAGTRARDRQAGFVRDD